MKIKNIPIFFFRFIFKSTKKAIFGVGLITTTGLTIVVLQLAKEKTLEQGTTLVIHMKHSLLNDYQCVVSKFLGKNSLSFFQLVSALENAIYDRRIKSVSIIANKSIFGVAETQELRSLIAKIKKHKPVNFFTTSFGFLSGGNSLYYLASICSSINIQKSGVVAITGVGTEVSYYKKAFDKYGVNAEFFGREEYKSAIEPYTRENMSPESREMLMDVFNSFENTFSLAISKRLSCDQQKAIEYIHNGPHTAESALRIKLIDAIISREDFEEKYNSKKKINISEYAYLLAMKALKKEIIHIKTKQHYVALITIHGAISNTKQNKFGKSVVANKIADKIRKLSDDKNVKALVIRIDSPGGEVSASEEIRSSIQYFRKRGKKVVVSMGNITASGGYWIASESDVIFANSATITGSIGVFAGKMSFGKLAEDFLIKSDTCTTSDNVLSQSIMRPFSEHDKQKMIELIDSCYKDFLLRVSESRNISIEDTIKVAKGRIWSGESAQKHKLVDKIGGLLTAVEEAKKISGLSEDAIVKNISCQSECFWNIFDIIDDMISIVSFFDWIKNSISQDNQAQAKCNIDQIK